MAGTNAPQSPTGQSALGFADPAGDFQPLSALNPLPMVPVGGAAPGTVPTANPVLFGGTAASSAPADTADGRVVTLYLDPKGRPHVINDGALTPSADSVSLGADAASPGSLDTLLTDALTATKVEVKAGAGRLHFLHVHNPNAFVCWLHFYDSAAAGVTVGTTARKVSFGIPASIDRLVALPVPIGFTTGMTHAATKTAITGAVAPDVGLTVVVGYK